MTTIGRIKPVTEVLGAVQLPHLQEFVVSPGFAGAEIAVAALIAVGAVLYAVRRIGKRFEEGQEQREHHHQQVREDQQRAVDIRECRERFQWLVDTAGIEPTSRADTTLGLTPDVAFELLNGLQRDAQRLNDQTLTDAVIAYKSKFARVLTRQAGPLSASAAAAGRSLDGARQGQPTSPAPTNAARPDQSSSEGEPDGPPPDEAAAATAEVAVSGRRRQR